MLSTGQVGGAAKGSERPSKERGLRCSNVWDRAITPSTDASGVPLPKASEQKVKFPERLQFSVN